MKAVTCHITFYNACCPICGKEMFKGPDWRASGHLDLAPVGLSCADRHVIYAACSKCFDKVMEQEKPNRSTGYGYRGDWKIDHGVLAEVSYYGEDGKVIERKTVRVV